MRVPHGQFRFRLLGRALQGVLDDLIQRKHRIVAEGFEPRLYRLDAFVEFLADVGGKLFGFGFGDEDGLGHGTLSMCSGQWWQRC